MAMVDFQNVPPVVRNFIKTKTQCKSEPIVQTKDNKVSHFKRVLTYNSPL